jgi:hypothetical protein
MRLKAIDKALNRRAALFRFFNQDAIDGAVARFGDHRQLYQTIDAGGAGRHAFPGVTLHRHGFTG